MDALLGGSQAARTIISSDIFDAKTNVVHQHKEASDKSDENNGSNTVKSTPPHVT